MSGTQNTGGVADPEIALKLPLSAVNFVLGSLDSNPLKAPVSQVSALMQSITHQAQNQPLPPAESSVQAAVKEAVARKRK